jgi:hypothetical protein
MAIGALALASSRINCALPIDPSRTSLSDRLLIDTQASQGVSAHFNLFSIPDNSHLLFFSLRPTHLPEMKIAWVCPLT